MTPFFIQVYESLTAFFGRYVWPPNSNLIWALLAWHGINLHLNFLVLFYEGYRKPLVYFRTWGLYTIRILCAIFGLVAANRMALINNLLSVLPVGVLTLWEACAVLLTLCLLARMHFFPKPVNDLFNRLDAKFDR